MANKTLDERVLDLEQQIERIEAHLTEVEKLAQNPVVKIIRKRKKSTKKPKKKEGDGRGTVNIDSA